VTLREIVVWALVIAAGALQVLACLGVLLMRDAYDRLHYTAPSALGGLCAAGAVLCAGGWSLIALKALLLAAILLVTAPVLTHATARAIHARGQRP
jgi:multicomponent Na+:H+ antiporter subunit G